MMSCQNFLISTNFRSFAIEVAEEKRVFSRTLDLKMPVDAVTIDLKLVVQTYVVCVFRGIPS